MCNLIFKFLVFSVIAFSLTDLAYAQSRQTKKPTTQISKWRYKDKSASIAHQNSTLSVYFSSEKQKPVVALSVYPGTSTATDRRDTVKVAYSVDNKPFETNYWNWRDKQTCFIEGSGLIKKLIRGNNVKIRVYRKDGNFQEYQFSLKGSATAIRRVLNNGSGFERKISGEWWDSRWNQAVKIYTRDGKFFMTDAWGVEEMEKCSPPRPDMRPPEWTTFAIIDRVGEPDNKYAINHKDGKLYYYTNCEFGSCSLSRIMEKTK